MTEQPDEADLPKIPCLFATIHFKSEQRPDGYTDDDIKQMNLSANEDQP